ncbi:MAG: carboxypeptidase-like regulatory domain-containing protein [Gemmatimonadaceae bacterium]
MIAPDTAGRTLAIAAAAAPYHVDETVGTQGGITGDVLSALALPVDTTVTPNRDSTGCKPFEDVAFPRERTARSARGTKRDTTDVAVGNALVWLVGVTHGPRDTQPRRLNITLNDCHIEPRVMVAPVGATIIVSNRDDMIARLRFEDHGRTSSPRAIIGFTDPGQVVPSSLALAKPGLVEVRDENHSWVRAVIAVAPHPFVAVTEANGDFQFDGVPPGSYQLVVWHERLGARVIPVKVEQGVSTPVTVRY